MMMYQLLSTCYISFLLVSNVISPKLFAWGSHAIPVGLITYPLTYALADVITEIYGGAKARQCILLALIANAIFLLFAAVAIQLPAHPQWFQIDNPHEFSSLIDYERAYGFIFSTNIKIVIASLSAYLISQLIDVSLFEYIKKKTKGRHLWLRNNISTLLSQAVDSLIVSGITLFWGFGLDFKIACEILLLSIAYKSFFSLFSTPLVYLLCKQLRPSVHLQA